MSRNDDRVTFNITYYPVFKNIIILLKELHILLAPDEQHRKVFIDIIRLGFKNGKSLKDHLVYLIECIQCCKQCTGSSKTKFRYRANNYKSTHRKFKNKKQVPKEALKRKIFHEHFCSDDHNGIQDWVITLIESNLIKITLS